jgi:hypothetical protein
MTHRNRLLGEDVIETCGVSGLSLCVMYTKSLDCIHRLSPSHQCLRSSSTSTIPSTSLLCQRQGSSLRIEQGDFELVCDFGAEVAINDEVESFAASCHVCLLWRLMDTWYTGQKCSRQQLQPSRQVGCLHSSCA